MEQERIRVLEAQVSQYERIVREQQKTIQSLFNQWLEATCEITQNTFHMSLLPPIDSEDVSLPQ